MTGGMPGLPGDSQDFAATPGESWLDGASAKSDEQIQSGSEDLRTSLVALAHLATGQMDLRDVLTRVAEFAVLAIPGADGAGLTLMEAGHADTIVASAPFVAEVDAVQYGIEEGPCVTAAAEAHIVCSGELDTDTQWPRFGPMIGHLGVHSALSIPLLTRAGVLGAMNVYARKRDAFDENGARIGELFAAPAAIAVQNAQVLSQTRRLASQLQSALTNQAVLDQAIGVLMSRLGCSAEQAFERLTATSRTEDDEVQIIAQRVVEETVQRARPGRRQP